MKVPPIKTTALDNNHASLTVFRLLLIYFLEKHFPHFLGIFSILFFTLPEEKLCCVCQWAHHDGVQTFPLDPRPITVVMFQGLDSNVESTEASCVTSQMSKQGPGSLYDMQIAAAELNKNMSSSVPIQPLLIVVTCNFVEEQE